MNWFLRLLEWCFTGIWPQPPVPRPVAPKETWVWASDCLPPKGVHVQLRRLLESSYTGGTSYVYYGKFFKYSFLMDGRVCLVFDDLMGHLPADATEWLRTPHLEAQEETVMEEDE